VAEAKQGEHLPKQRKQRKPIARNRALETLISRKDYGELPHEFLLRVTRGDAIMHGMDEKGEPIFVRPTFEQRIDAAKYAAPFYAPKLAQVEVLTDTTDEELDTIIEQLAREAGAAIGLEGEGSQDQIEAEQDPDTPDSLASPWLRRDLAGSS
jgi:hypothetical protein